MLKISKFLHKDKLKFVKNSISNFNCNVMKNSENVLLKVRILFYVMAFIHLVVVSIILLTIDFTEAEDPSLWMYANVRWKLITCWFNLLSLVYLPICIYCDLKELRDEDKELHVKRLNNIRFLIFTSILLPTSIFADILFWRLWMKDRELLAPVTVDAIVPFWTQHCMHTVSLVVTILDVVLVPRTRPKSVVPGLSIMSIFLFSYVTV
ncbi:unnamed protein product [Diatraea saccharalis]|uniref:Androgen-dependent TFPI-regulating protein-like n=1 Tax=Diatraea saccharalis TaxID=40085 RepID=A0A9N9QY05_9NEOP|nr:unnamed protein product [Diatraea saccharalis]